MARFNLEDYVTVQERIVTFWKDHPEGAIRTQLESPSDNFDICRYSAAVFTHRDHPQPDTVGWAFEKAGGGGPNSTSHEENCETSAIGRALANLGYATSQKDRPSREEMAKVNNNQPPPTPIRNDPDQREKVNKALHAQVRHPQLHAWAVKQGWESLNEADLEMMLKLNTSLRDPKQLAAFNAKYPAEAVS